ncbi:uncharacterized protein LOC125510355 [Triticum urartu]|uniref:Uncharacterized protein n=1 Tax=Triticum urartu TaxID=4572 RepID=A0A8R7QI72_TRIUA|nr:uncharacterized protein LOC125510355 [Triticum urartu]
MGKKNPNARRFASSERAPSLDVTNSPLNANAESSSAARQKGNQSWYIRLSDEKKAELLEKRRVARREKKTAAVQSVNHARVSQEHASSVGSEQFVPLSNITNTHIDVAVCTAASSAGTAHLHQNNIAGKKRSPQSWYAGLSDERRAEYIHKQKMARLARKAATAGVNVQLPTSSASQTSSGPSVCRCCQSRAYCLENRRSVRALCCICGGTGQK